ncbi:hypothetical protein KOR34_52840 [Posidoniimonas corsicana]|uniref:DUF1559 domain-containing protein n=1 Tax=Posidoniimonas corsicana TaxID=1938618 RepID=A0A5C5UTN9_9BACT|nr:DUF1559 domain-containing protein [Posidoniimonas corsicana]TWT29229.1 hypothetical protein KOR34_52840 [Posidoniimonas corsicana]
MTAPRLFACSLLLAPLLCGCGGGPSKNEMLERARMRSAMNKINDQQAAASEAAQPAPQPPAEVRHEEPVDSAAVADDAPPTAGNQPPAESQPSAPAVAQTPAAAATSEPAAPPAAVALAPLERDRQAADKLRRIAAAVIAYAEEHGEYPQQGADKLSWRVRILPQLGFEELYKQFNPKQPWDGPQNKALLPQIPDVFRSPSRADDRTSFFAAGGQATMFWHPVRATYLRTLERNAASTVMLVEGADADAVPWTQPTDFERSLESPQQGLDSRGDSALVAWADGTVNRLLLTAPAQQLTDAFRVYEEDDTKRLQTAGITAPVDQPAEVASTAAGGGSGAAPGSAGSGGGARTAAARPTSELAQSYLAAAQAAFLQGESGQAWSWCSGAILAGLPQSQWRDDFRWVSGLKRPTLGPHIALGVLLDIAPNGALPRNPNRDERLKLSLQAAAPIGEHLVRILDEHAAERLPGALRPAEGDRRRPARPDDLPGIVTCLTPSMQMATIRREAIESGCDVLALMTVDNSASRRSRSIELRLYDMQRGADQLLRVRKVTAAVNESPLHESTQERLQAARWQLKDFLQDSLTPGEWPVKLTDELAAGRLTSLAAGRSDHPLPSLIEMLHYRDLGLVDDIAVLRAYGGLLGDERAAPLLLGSDLKKRRVLRHFLPSDDPDAVVAMTARNRRDNDDD